MTELSPITQTIVNAINDYDKQTIQDIITNASDKDCHLILQQLSFEGFFQDNPLFSQKYRKWEKTQFIEQCY